MAVGIVPRGSGREGLPLALQECIKVLHELGCSPLITRVGEELDSSQLRNRQVGTSLVVQW